MNKLIPLIVFSVLLLVPLAGQNAFATDLSCFADMSGANETPPTTSLGTGTMTGTFDTNTNQLSWNISWSGLASQEVGMHFHGPASPTQNAGVQVDIGAISGLVSPSVGNTILNAQQETDLLAGLWYVNLHTVNNPPGAIRGQVACGQVVGGEIIPIETTALLLAGVQSNLAWILPVVLAGAGFAAYKLRRS